MNIGVALLAAEGDQIIYLNCKYDDTENNQNRTLIIKIDLNNEI